ncbi:MAG: cytochrome P450 [Acidobacteriota bacterium]|nr:cytochrome P450 [Acidobacteriota bacterium]
MATSFAAERASVPGPSTWLPGGAYWAFRRDPLAFFTDTARTYGDIAGFKFGPQKVYLVSRPEWIEDILVKSAGKFGKGIALERAKVLLGNGLLTAAGQEHLKHRRMIQPLFHRQHVQGFADTFVRHAARWRDQVTAGAQLDITREMSGLTLGIIGETMFSSDVQGDADEVREALTDAVANFAYAFIPGLDYLQKLPLPMFVRMRTARERLDRVIHRVIAERRTGNPKKGLPPPKPDLISMLLAARDPENPNEGGMGDGQIRDEAMTIFLAGHETTANAMAWTWHLLATAPEVEARLHAELDRVVGQPQEGVAPTLTMEDVPKLEWTRAIVSESMRLYPPAWTMGRRVLDDHAIGGHTIAKGSLVILSQWVVHRDPRWWDEAESFKPERWLAQSESSVSSAARPRYAYFPFGGGSRVCIGEAFAWTEAILLLATIAQRWRFARGTHPAPTTEPRITLRPKGLKMNAVARSG